jgi:hypothetical protein
LGCSETVVYARSQSDTAAYRFAVYAADDEFGAFTHGIDDMGKSTEKTGTSFEVFNSHELIEAGSCAKGFLPFTAQYDNYRCGVSTYACDGIA